MMSSAFQILLLTLSTVVPNEMAASESPVDGVFCVAHPDHGASFLEQLTGQWVIEEKKGVVQKRLRFYEDGRFGFMDAGDWTAGSFVILRSDERQKGVLRLEFYVDGNLHLQEVRVEVHFEDHVHEGEDAQEHGHDHDSQGAAEKQHHEYLLVEVLPAVEQSLEMGGDYLHRH